jgi:hypothetical protein
LQRLKIVNQLDNVYRDHPEWKKLSRLDDKSTKDHSKTLDWTGDLTVKQLEKSVLESIWLNGYNKAKDFLQSRGQNSFTDLDFIISSLKVCVLNPFGKDRPFEQKEDGEIEDIEEADVESNNEVRLLEDSNEPLISELVTDQFTQSNTFTNIVSVNGISYNKSNYVSHYLLKETKLTTFRPHRVMSKKTNNVIHDESRDVDLLDVYLLGDHFTTYVVNDSDKEIYLCVFVAHSIKVNGVAQVSIPKNQLNEAYLDGIPLLLDQMMDDNLAWNETYLPNQKLLQISGAICLPIEMFLTVNLKKFFDFNDINNHILFFESYLKNHSDFRQTDIEAYKISEVTSKLKIKNNININTKTKIQSLVCKVNGCGKVINRDLMRSHVAMHILTSNSEFMKHEHLCGFCGTLCGNQVQIKVTSGSGKYATRGGISSCDYSTKLSLDRAQKGIFTYYYIIKCIMFYFLLIKYKELIVILRQIVR